LRASPVHFGLNVPAAVTVLAKTVMDADYEAGNQMYSVAAQMDHTHFSSQKRGPAHMAFANRYGSFASGLVYPDRRAALGRESLADSIVFSDGHILNDVQPGRIVADLLVATEAPVSPVRAAESEEVQHAAQSARGIG
jgi:hypothetical protein